MQLRVSEARHCAQAHRFAVGAWSPLPPHLLFTLLALALLMFLLVCTCYCACVRLSGGRCGRASEACTNSAGEPLDVTAYEAADGLLQFPPSTFSAGTLRINVTASKGYESAWTFVSVGVQLCDGCSSGKQAMRLTTPAAVSPFLHPTPHPPPTPFSLTSHTYFLSARDARCRAVVGQTA